jgi:hypothetical protein
MSDILVAVIRAVDSWSFVDMAIFAFGVYVLGLIGKALLAVWRADPHRFEELRNLTGSYRNVSHGKLRDGGREHANMASVACGLRLGPDGNVAQQRVSDSAILDLYPTRHR